MLRKFLGKVIGKKEQAVLSSVYAASLFDDWNFLLTVFYYDWPLLLLNCASNLVIPCYVTCMVIFMNQYKFEGMIRKDLPSMKQVIFEKTKFILLDLINLTILMTGKQDRQRQDKLDSFEIIFAMMPHILLKQMVVFESGETMSGYQIASIMKSMLILSF